MLPESAREPGLRADRPRGSELFPKGRTGAPRRQHTLAPYALITYTLSFLSIVYKSGRRAKRSSRLFVYRN